MHIQPLPPQPAEPPDGDADRMVVSQLQHDRGPELYAFARRLGLSSEAAEDAVQESLMRLWMAIAAGDPIAKPDAWAFRALYRICMDNYRWHRRVARLVERLRPATERSVAPTVIDRITVWHAVDQLPKRQRAAVYLRYRADLPYEEIGAVLGIQAVSARSTVSRALDRLGHLLSKEEFR
ncbi:sigma-70 family RNA polymerase sigma factor [soil metagenome]